MKELTRHDLTGMECSASFSECETYRYLLTWRWSRAPLLVAWMLNPSTATHEQLDPTIKGLKTRAAAWGHGGVRVINLFAFRATKPEDMKVAADPIGPENDAVILATLAEAAAHQDFVICGWGAHGSHRGRDREAMALAAQGGAALHALAKNDDGSPTHPLYVRHSALPFAWRPAEDRT